MSSSGELGLKGGRLSLEEVKDVAVSRRKVRLSPEAVQAIGISHQFVQRQIATGQTIYGLNTGFGPLSDVRIPPDQIEKLQYNFLRSHAAGIGTPIPDSHVRAMLLLRANALAIGKSGVSLEVVNQLIEFLNRGVHPIVPEQGSVGASGDLAPLAHMCLLLIGEGKARIDGLEMSGKEALEKVGLKPVKLGPKEGLALTNGTQFMSAFGVLNLLEAERLCDVADAAAAMSVEALRGTSTAFDSLIHEARPHPGQIRVAQRMRAFLVDGGYSEISKSHRECGRVQDPYSFRCVPQVHGASRDALRWVREVLEREINSVTDNPLVFAAQEKILSGGNFHGQILSIAMDLLSIAVAELGSISEERIDKLVNPAFSGLPAFLIQDSGVNSGLMIVQYAAASIVSENKTLCHPASVDSIPTSLHKEDHVSMGAWAARKAAKVVENVRRILSMEFLAAAQGVELLRPLKTGERLEKIHSLIRSNVAGLTVDRSPHEDVLWIEGALKEGKFDSLIS